MKIMFGSREQNLLFELEEFLNCRFNVTVLNHLHIEIESENEQDIELFSISLNPDPLEPIMGALYWWKHREFLHPEEQKKRMSWFNVSEFNRIQEQATIRFNKPKTLFQVGYERKRLEAISLNILSGEITNVIKEKELWICFNSEPKQREGDFLVLILNHKDDSDKIKDIFHGLITLAHKKMNYQDIKSSDVEKCAEKLLEKYN